MKALKKYSLSYEKPTFRQKSRLFGQAREMKKLEKITIF